MIVVVVFDLGSLSHLFLFYSFSSLSSTLLCYFPAKPKATPNPPAPASTSTTPLPEIIKPRLPPPKKVTTPKKVLTWEESTKEWFSQFEDETEKGVMTGEGVEKLFEDMGVEMEGVSFVPFLLTFLGMWKSMNLCLFLDHYWDSRMAEMSRPLRKKKV